jgi:hypothetical protein
VIAELQNWYGDLANHEGKGKQAPRPGSLAGLHAARAAHEGQFLTPAPVARLAWELVQPALRSQPGRMIHLFDNSVGTGRLLQFAEPDRHTLTGVDVDDQCIHALIGQSEAAGFVVDMETAGMQDIQPRGYDVGLINPPFSIHLESPHLVPFDGSTTWGRYGPGTGAMSHAYALAQALHACQVVAAILPRNYAESLPDHPITQQRLQALVHLPASAFRSAGAEVRTSIAVFGADTSEQPPQIVHWHEGGTIPTIPLALTRTDPPAKLGLRHTRDDGPTITTPVTGDNTVRVYHSGRHIKLGFRCGLTEAKVLNAIYQAPLPNLENHRHPKGLQYTGQYRLDTEVHLQQPDPRASIDELLDAIRAAGGVPVVDDGFTGYVKARIRRHRREIEPCYRVVKTPGQGNRITATAKHTVMLDPDRWGSPVVRRGETIECRHDAAAGTYEVTQQDVTRVYDDNGLRQDFDVSLPDTAKPGWRHIFAGKRTEFPALEQRIRRHAKQLGLDQWLSWQYQLDDYCEAMIAPRGQVVGWEPAMGKARLALAFALGTNCQHALVIVEAGLLAEMQREIRLLGIASDQWQVLTRPRQVNGLRRINLITYERLRAPICRGAGRRTWARLLRRRCGTVVCDEADHLAHMDTAQSRAVRMLSPRRRFALVGEPSVNYPRHLLPILAWVHGDGTAAQPYGYRHAYIDPELVKSAAYAVRGVYQFRDRFVTLEWVTNQFAEKMTEGAKREVPKVQHLGEFRAFHAPLMLRRTVDEPDCKPYLPMPRARTFTHRVEWDQAHLAHYLTVAEEFATWFQRAKGSDKQVNLVQVLARIGAVIAAADHPHNPRPHCPAYTQPTSKQRGIVERLAWLTEHGHKAVVYSHSPALLERLHGMLDTTGIESVLFHGKKPPARRMRELDNRFRFGPAPVALMSMGVAEKGLNIPQANRVLFYDRDWTAKKERQAMKRVLRAQQKRRVLAEFWHLAGSINDYQAQMVAHKADASDAAIDWQAPTLADADFLHLDTLLGQFCEDLAELRGVERGRLREALAA